jgi:hypothetical protein
MDSAEHFSTVSQIKGQVLGGTMAEELTDVVAEKATTANTASSSVAADHAKSIQSIGKLIQDLFHSDYAKVNAALKALGLDLVEDENKEAAMLLFICWRISSAGQFTSFRRVIKSPS